MIKLIKIFSSLAFFGLFMGLIAAFYVYSEIAPGLPSIENLEDTSYQVPLRIYDKHEELLAEYGEHRRIPAKFEDLPNVLVQAFVAAEDDEFWNHSGVDPYALVAAAYSLVTTGKKTRGGSTITMQVARNFYLTKDKTYKRKLSEILLALKIEKELSKEKILELYLNKIFLGHRSYGVVAAGLKYYGKPLSELSIAEAAMVAGLPKAPSRYNPVTNPKRALLRRDHILSRMNYLNYISNKEYETAKAMPVTAKLHQSFVAADARYVTEMVRAELYKEYGDDIYKLGLNAYTTIDGRLQSQANKALRKALLDYDRRHGYRGVTTHVELGDVVAQNPEETTNENSVETAKKIAKEKQIDDPFEAGLVKKSSVGNLQQGVVLHVSDDSAEVALPDNLKISIPFKTGIDWAREYINENKVGKELKSANEVLTRGDVIWVEKRGEGDNEIWLLASIPSVEGALVSISPYDGAINAMVGGFDFFNSKFNRATQAKRQPGSNFKPFIYSSALEDGFTAATLVNDAPVVFEDDSLEASWRPENYSGKVYGPTRLREALVKSRNLVSIRVLRTVGLKKAINHAQKFGFNKKDMPYDLSLSLGSGSFSPLEIVRGYAVFANGGYLVNPYMLSRVEDSDGNVVFEEKPATVCQSCGLDAIEKETMSDNEVEAEELYATRVISEQNAYIMRSIMREVVRRGTAVRAKVLGRTDFGGKTGTTNDQRDAWFSGFNDQVVTTAWVGFDDIKPLGRKETGGRAALPAWVDYMRLAFDGMVVNTEDEPQGMVTVRIDEKTGERVTSGTTASRFEIFRKGHEPAELAKLIERNGPLVTETELEEQSESLF